VLRPEPPDCEPTCQEFVVHVTVNDQLRLSPEP
jgi:hypothetical protein